MLDGYVGDVSYISDILVLIGDLFSVQINFHGISFQPFMIVIFGVTIWLIKKGLLVIADSDLGNIISIFRSHL